MKDKLKQKLNNKFLPKTVVSETPSILAFCGLNLNFENSIISNTRNQYF